MIAIPPALARRVLDAAPDAMVIIDAFGTIWFANRRVSALFGYADDEIIGESIETLMPERLRAHHIGHRMHFLSNVRVRAMGTGIDLYGQRCDGTEFPLEVSLSPIEDVGQTLVVAAIRDVTDRKRVEAELVVARDAIEAMRELASSKITPHPSTGAAVHSPDTGIDLTELESAATLVHRVMPPTPQYAWPKLRRRAGCTVWVKHENHTPTGAFKVRGGLVYLDRLRHAVPKSPGVISATRGNHGQSIAFAAARTGIPATIYVPHNNSLDQNSAIAAFGARVIEFGKDFDEAKHEASRVAAAEGLHLVPSFHRDLVAGVATYALELFHAVGELDAVYVGVGMGSGITGLITVRDLLGLKTEIIGVGAAKAPATALSFAAGRPINAPSAQTFADGLATREPHPQAISTICRGAARMVEVDENSIAEAMGIYFDDTHQIAEGAGAAPLAALLQERHRMANKNVAVVLSGGNIERARFLQVLSGITPAA